MNKKLKLYDMVFLEWQAGDGNLLSSAAGSSKDSERFLKAHPIWVPERYPFALLTLGPPLLKPNSMKKGTLIIKSIKRLLMNQAI